MASSVSLIIILIMLIGGVGYYYYRKRGWRLPRFKQESVDETIARLKEETDMEEHKKQDLIKLRDAKQSLIKTRTDNAKLRKEIDSIGVKR